MSPGSWMTMRLFRTTTLRPTLVSLSRRAFRSLRRFFMSSSCLRRASYSDIACFSFDFSSSDFERSTPIPFRRDLSSSICCCAAEHFFSSSAWREFAASRSALSFEMSRCACCHSSSLCPQPAIPSVQNESVKAMNSNAAGALMKVGIVDLSSFAKNRAEPIDRVRRGQGVRVCGPGTPSPRPGSSPWGSPMSTF